MYLLGALSGGLWIIPVGLLLLSIWSFYRGYTQWKSGSAGYDANHKWTESDERVSFWSIGATVFGIILLLASIGSFIWMQLEK